MMVIPLLLMYLFGVALLATFLVTKRYLKSQSDSIGSNEKYVHGLNFMSFVWTFVCIFMLSFMEFLVIKTPTSLWPLVIEFFNEALSIFSLHNLIMLSFFTIVLLIGGYFHDSRASYVPVNAVSQFWLRILMILYIVVGIIGALTGILL